MDYEMTLPVENLLSGKLPQELLEKIVSPSTVVTTVTIKLLENFGTILHEDATLTDGDSTSVLSKQLVSDGKADHVAFVSQFLKDFEFMYKTDHVSMIGEALNVSEEIKAVFDEAVKLLEDDQLPLIKRINYKVYINIVSEFIDNRFVVVKVKGV